MRASADGARALARRLRGRDTRQALALFVGILVVALVLATGTAEPGQARSGYLGGAAPDFVAQDADGAPVRLGDLRGRPVWLNFFSTWCVRCRAENPDIDVVYRERRAAGSDMAFLAVGVGETSRTVTEYARTAGLTFPFAADPERSASRRYAVLALPTHVFVDREGVVRDIRIGALRIEEMRELVTAVERAR